MAAVRLWRASPAFGGPHVIKKVLGGAAADNPSTELPRPLRSLAQRPGHNACWRGPSATRSAVRPLHPTPNPPYAIPYGPPAVQPQPPVRAERCILAIFTSGPAVAAISGSVGGNTFSHNKGGAYVRQRSVPTNPTSERQTAVRTAFGTCASYWTDLTASQQTAWAQYAATHPVLNALGQSVLISGLAMFCSCNARLIDAGESLVVTPPAGDAPTAPATLTVAPLDDESATYTYAGTVPADGFLVIYQTIPAPPGADPNFNQARLVEYVAAASATSPYSGSTRPAVAGQTANFYVAFLAPDGLVSAFLKDGPVAYAAAP